MSQVIDLEINKNEKVKANLNHKHLKKSKDFADWVSKYLSGVDYAQYDVTNTN